MDEEKRIIWIGEEGRKEEEENRQVGGRRRRRKKAGSLHSQLWRGRSLLPHFTSRAFRHL